MNGPTTDAEFVQWPTTREGENTVTADTLARYYAQTFQINYGIIQECIDGPVFTKAILQQVHAWTIVRLLRALPDAEADEVARDIVRALNSGDALAELMWQWLTEYDMDPEALAAEGVRFYREKHGATGGAA